MTINDHAHWLVMQALGGKRIGKAISATLRRGPRVFWIMLADSRRIGRYVGADRWAAELELRR